MPLLTLLVAVPLAGVALVAMIGREREALIHRVALATSLVVFGLTLVVWARRAKSKRGATRTRNSK